jgi:transcriptional regulator GlxA family with amidase domain
MQPDHRVVFLLHDGCELIDLAGPAAVFGAARDPAGRRRYEVRTVSVAGTPVRTDEGVTVAVDGPAAGTGPIDTLVVPGGLAVAGAAGDAVFLAALRALAGRSRRIASVCSGAVLLAAAGLLDGRRATTHWAALDQMREQFPRVDVAHAVVWVRDGDVYSSAGATTGIDLALALVEADLGVHVAGQVARWLVVFARRPGGQPQSSVRARLPEPATAALRRALDAAVADPAGDLSVAALAARAALSPRHFSRVFVAELGLTPAAYVERIRIEAAQQYLEASGATLEVVAKAAGFRSAETMRRAFHRVLGTAPGAFREAVTAWSRPRAVPPDPVRGPRSSASRPAAAPARIPS